MRSGYQVVFEGPDGSGKGTQAELAKTKLEQRGIAVQVLVEPGGDRVGQILRSILKGVPDDPVIKLLFDGQTPHLQPATEVLLFNACRAQLMPTIDELRRQGQWVLGDRSFISTLAYQGFGDGQDLQQLKQICNFALQGIKPDLVLFLSIPYHRVVERLRLRGGTDRFESRGPDYAERVHHGYEAIAKELGLPIINADQSIEHVARDIWQHIEPLLEEEQS